MLWHRSTRTGSSVFTDDSATLDQIGIPKSTFYTWYERYASGGPDGLEGRKRHPKRVWNRIADEKVLELALTEPELGPRDQGGSGQAFDLRTS